MPEQAFIELSILIVTTLVICGIFKFLRQPIMIGYVISGIILSPNVLGIIHHSEGMATFSQIGISFLLFMVGLGLNPKHIKDIGKTALIAALFQVTITGTATFFLSQYFNFPIVASLYIAIGLSFSSTIVIMKLLTDKLTLESLPGKISIGILIIQDLLAMTALIVISSLTKEGNLATVLLPMIGKGIVLISSLMIFSHRVLPTITRAIAGSQEMLLLFSIAWCLAIASASNALGFSIEIGALLAGVSLSLSPYRYEISAKMKPLRDFFIMLFFVSLGTEMQFNDLSSLLIPMITLTALIVLINPLVMTILISRIGYTKRTSFLAGINFSQISEFSLIVATLGVKVGHIDQKILSLLTLIALLSITLSTYFIIYSEKIFKRSINILKYFEKKGPKIDQNKPFNHNLHDIILVGYAKMGVSLIESFNAMKKKFFIIDYNPEVIQELTGQNIDCLYADIGNLDTYEEINFKDAKMIISTVKDIESNEMLISLVRQSNKNALIIVLSHNIDSALKLYELGADYVIMPFHIGGRHTSKLISEFGFDHEKFFFKKDRHISKLLIRKGLSNNST